MNILYIHGLESRLSPEKKAILEEYGNILAPSLDYHRDPKAIETILKAYKDDNVDVVIGSSIGGFAGYYVSTQLKAPALLFNPALKNRSVEQNVPEVVIGSLSIKHFVLGARDEVVKPADTLDFISENYSEFTDFHIHIHHDLAHQIRVEIFKDEVAAFMEKI